MSVTILDIATQAGTSKSTVSRFLNGESINARTAEKIRKAISSTGYTPNINARRLVKSRSYVIGVVFDDIANYTYGGMMDGVQRAAQEQGYDCMFLSRATDRSKEADYFRLITSSTVDGLIFTSLGRRDPGQTELLAASGLPCVLVGDAGQCGSLPAVDVDNLGGTQMEIEHLIRKGHQRIAYLVGPECMPAAGERLEGYIQALGRHGVPFDTDLVVPADWSVKDSYAVVKRLIRDASFTAIAASNAYSAYGAYLAVSDAGYRVPEDIAVAGFDDDPLCEHTRPGITTLRQPFPQIGQKAVELLIPRIERQDAEARVWKIMPELVVRGSTETERG